MNILVTALFRPFIHSVVCPCSLSYGFHSLVWFYFSTFLNVLLPKIKIRNAGESLLWVSVSTLSNLIAFVFCRRVWTEEKCRHVSIKAFSTVTQSFFLFSPSFVKGDNDDSFEIILFTIKIKKEKYLKENERNIKKHWIYKKTLRKIHDLKHVIQMISIKKVCTLLLKVKACQCQSES